MPVARLDGRIEGARPPYGAPPREVLDRLGYLCEEYALAGTAVAYAHPGTATPDGRWDAEPIGEAPFRTRLLVLRPSDAGRANGTVLLNWQNVSAGYEQRAPVEGEVYRGYVWVGVSAQEVGLYGMPMGRRGIAGGLPLLDADADRYGELRHPGDQGSFEIFSAAAAAVRQLDDVPARRVVAIGGSQSAMRLCAYANAIHPLHRLVDAFLLSVWEGHAPRLEDGPMSMYRTTTIRDDLDVPVLVVNSEFEVTATHGLPLHDHDRRRVWEVAGTGHGTSRRNVTGSSGWGPNPVGWQPVHEAATRSVHRWLTDGSAPAAAPRVEIDEGPPPSARRGDDGNAIGGIRLPEIAVPVAQHRGRQTGTGALPLFGGRLPYDDDAIRQRYGSRAEYVERWRAAVDELVGAGHLLPEDAPGYAERGGAVAAALPLP